MHSISRRGFVISAATAGAAFGLDGPLEFIGPAFAQTRSGKLLDKGFVKFKVGDIEVTQIYDGIWEKAHDGTLSRTPRWTRSKAALKAGGADRRVRADSLHRHRRHDQGQARPVRRRAPAASSAPRPAWSPPRT